MHMRVKDGQVFVDQHGVSRPDVLIVHDNDPAFDRNRTSGVLEHVPPGTDLEAWIAERGQGAKAPAKGGPEKGEGKKGGKGKEKPPKE